MFKNKMLGSVRMFYGPADKPGDASDDNDTNDDTVDETDDQDDGDTGDDDSSDSDEGDGSSDDADSDDADDDSDDEDDKPDANASKADKADWRDRQLAKQHRKIQEGIRRAAELEAENATLRAIAEGRDPKDPPPAKKPAAASSDPDPVATAKAQIRNEDAQAKFDADCNAAYATGKGRYKKDWDTKLARLPILGGIDNSTMEYIVASDDPAKVLYTMASDPDEYERIMGLPPAKRATAIAKLGIPDKPAPKGASNAPQPVTPIGRNATPSGKRINPADPKSDSVPDEEWFAARERQRQERFAKKQGRR